MPRNVTSMKVIKLEAGVILKGLQFHFKVSNMFESEEEMKSSNAALYLKRQNTLGLTPLYLNYTVLSLGEHDEIVDHI